jgi:hypothetical protein
MCHVVIGGQRTHVFCHIRIAAALEEDESVANANPSTDTTSFRRALEPPVSQDLEPPSILIVFL